MIFRNASADDDYFQFSRQAAQDGSLSLEARGMLAYLLSQSKTWRGLPAELSRSNGIKSKKCRRIIRELEIAGYLIFRKVHVDGRFNQWYDAWSSPRPEDMRTNSAMNCVKGGVPTEKYSPPQNRGAVNSQAVNSQAVKGGQDSREEEDTETVKEVFPLLEEKEKEREKEHAREAAPTPRKPATAEPVKRPFSRDDLPAPPTLAALTAILNENPLPQLDACKSHIGDAAIEACYLQYRSEQPLVEPYTRSTFLRDLRLWCNAIAYKSDGQASLQRNMVKVREYLQRSLTERNLNLPTFLILKELKLGENPEVPLPQPNNEERIHEERVKNCVSSLMSGLTDMNQLDARAASLEGYGEAVLHDATKVVRADPQYQLQLAGNAKMQARRAAWAALPLQKRKDEARRVFNGLPPLLKDRVVKWRKEDPDLKEVPMTLLDVLCPEVP